MLPSLLHRLQSAGSQRFPECPSAASPQRVGGNFVDFTQMYSRRLQALKKKQLESVIVQLEVIAAFPQTQLQADVGVHGVF